MEAVSVPAREQSAQNFGTSKCGSGVGRSDWCRGITRGGLAFCLCPCALTLQVSLTAFALLAFVVLLAHIRLYFPGPNRLFGAL